MRCLVKFILLFFTFINVYSNDILVFVDHTTNLDYYKNGKLYKIKDDLKSLYSQYQLNSKQQIIIVDLIKDNEKKFKGKVRVIGKEIKEKRRFNNKTSLIKLLDNYIKKPTRLDFLLLSHSLTKMRLKEFLSYANTKYGIILSSACKMATIDNLRLMRNYSDLVLASPENIHLAHLELNKLPKILKKEDALERGKLILNYSYERLLKYTKSNLVLNLYKLDNLQDKCSDIIWSNLIIDSKIKLSRFETRNLDNSNFKIYKCKN